ncbi:MAG: hypothetical protein ABJA67_08595 [Chthonomonadales bacterium]
MIRSLFTRRNLMTVASFCLAHLVFSLILPANSHAQTGQGINYRERPRYAFDPQRLKRRPVLDGAINANEWDPLYTITEGTAKGTVYLNWDDEFVYIACRADQASMLVIDLDCNADGWLRGADNLELVIGPSADGSLPATVSARILDAAGNKDTPVWNEKVVDVRQIQAVQKLAGGAWMVEVAIPKGIAGLVPRGGATLAVRADLLPAGAVPAPTAPYEPHLLIDCTLVESRTISAPGVTPKLVLDDSKLIPGQPLRATLELYNQTEEEMKVRSITWQGDGAAADIMNTVREVNIAPVKGLKQLRQKFNSPLSPTAVPGYYQMTVVAQLENGKTVSSTASFSVVEPFTLQMSTDPEIINVLGPVPIKVFVEITSAAPGSAKGDVEIELPAAWDLKGRKRKEFTVPREDSTIKVPFYVTLPSTTAAGDYTINATIYWKGKSWKVRKNVKISRTTEVPGAGSDATKKP